MRILTFDIEEWFHCDFISDSTTWDNYDERIYRNTDRILELLAEEKLKATFFCLGWIAEKYPEIVRKICASGHEVGCHSHVHELVYRQNRNAFKQDVECSLHLLEDILGEKVIMYRAPAFSITERTKWAFEILAEYGIEYDSSVFPAERDYGGFPSFGEVLPTLISVNGSFIKEFPINTMSVFSKKVVFSGGGYFRLFPYSLIKYWTKKSNYVMAYMHPRDFDYTQPILKQLPLNRKFKSYYGLKHAFPKFKKWLNDFEFQSLLEADKMINWEKSKIICI